MQIFVVDIQLFSRKPDSLNLGLPINQRVFFFLGRFRRAFVAAILRYSSKLSKM